MRITDRCLDSKHRIHVFDNKPPKLRWKPGQWLNYKGELWKVVYIYRVKENDREWQFCLEQPRDVRALDLLVYQMYLDWKKGKGQKPAMMPDWPTEEVEYGVFYSHMDAHTYFFSLPAMGDRCIATTKTLLKENQ